VPRDELATRLYQCGREFVEYLKHIARGDAEHLDNIRMMENRSSEVEGIMRAFAKLDLP